MKVSGSVLAVGNDYLEYARKLKDARIDYLHIDIFQDDGFALSDLYQFDESYLPLDVHLIYRSICEEDIELLNDVRVEYLNIQYENLIDKDQIYLISKKFKGKFGIAITADTSLAIVEKYIEDISQVLIMCSVPGVSGAKFNDLNYNRVLYLHEKYPSLRLIVDGGINEITGRKMSELGVEILVSGSYLCKDVKSLTKNGYFLKYMSESNINVKRKMLSYNELPIVSLEENFMNIILKMNKYRLGLVFVVVEQELEGIISDGDIRRCLLKYGESIFGKKAMEIMNRKPFIVNSSAYMENVYDQLFKIHKGIDVVPVMDDNKLIGALDLHIGR